LQLAKLRRNKVFGNVKGGFYSLEVTNEGKGWHVHFHLLVDARWIDAGELAKTWGKLVGQDYAIVKVKDCRGADYIREVTKYAVKGSQLAAWTPNDIAEFIVAFQGVRFFGVFGALFGKRTQWQEWIASVREIRPVCVCGCDQWRLMTPNEFAWNETIGSGHVALPPPMKTDNQLQFASVPA